MKRDDKKPEVVTEAPVLAHDPDAAGLLSWRGMPVEARWTAAYAAIAAGQRPEEMPRDAFRYRPADQLVMVVIPPQGGMKNGSAAVRRVHQEDEMRVRMAYARFPLVERMVRRG